MARNVTVRDKGWNRIKQQMRELDGAGVKVGLRAGAASGEVITYAIFNEFGTSTIPKRPFMRHTADTSEAAVTALMKRWAGMVVEGKQTVPQVLGLLGLHYVSRIQGTIRKAKSWATPLAASTIRRKGSTAPLVDQGVLVNSVDWERDNR